MEHLIKPPSRFYSEEQSKRRCLARLQSGLSIPRSTDPKSKRRTAFSLLYIMAVVFPIVISIASWSFLRPWELLSSSTKWPKALGRLIVANLNVVNSVIALLEVVALSSLPKHKVTLLFTKVGRG